MSRRDLPPAFVCGRDGERVGQTGRVSEADRAGVRLIGVRDASGAHPCFEARRAGLSAADDVQDPATSAMGIVKSSERWAEEGDFMRDELGRSARLGDLAPSRKGSLARSAAEVAGADLG
jgi:hypothetical protein